MKRGGRAEMRDGREEEGGRSLSYK